MKSKSAPRHAKPRAGKSIGGIPDSGLKEHAAGPATARIIVVALAVASLGAGAAALSGNGSSAGHASTPHQAGHASLTVNTSAVGTTAHPDVAWMW
jgi:hypothetical protein